MSRMRVVRRELLAFNTLQARKRELLERIDGHTIGPSTSRLNDMPKPFGGLPRSSVESKVLYGERIRLELDEIERLLLPINRAFEVLGDLEREVIERTFMGLQENGIQIARSLGLKQGEFGKIRDRAVELIGYTLELYGRC